MNDDVKLLIIHKTKYGTTNNMKYTNKLMNTILILNKIIS